MEEQQTYEEAEFEDAEPDGAPRGRLRHLLVLLGAAALFGGLLSGAISVVLYLFTDWFDPIGEFAHDHGILFWGPANRTPHHP
ncbi:hypothetical protein ACWEQL_25185 [Kitasatospora sp. NPDC004240]